MKPTPRQIEVLEAIVVSGDIHRAADRLGISYWTARTHVQNARHRTGYRTEQLIALGLIEGWLVVRGEIQPVAISVR